MVYATGIGSPATTEFYRWLGADEWHFGLIGGIPLLLLFLQFVGAAVVNRAARRKPTFIFCLIASRLVYLPIAFLPWDRMGMPVSSRMALVISLLLVSASLQNYSSPFSFSWLADLIPHAILNRFWGRRQLSMHITWTFSFLAVTLYLYTTGQPIAVVFRSLILTAVAAGVIDILLFLRVPEPPNLVDPDLSLRHSLLEPYRHVEYRSFVRYSCAWSFATMFAAAFMQLYVLKILELAPWKTALIWCLSGVGVGVVSALWGRMADRHGHRPVLNICVSLKPFIVIVFIALTRENVVWLLPAAFFLDGALNAGSMVAANGYMLSIAPQRNRSMFIAATTGLAGLAGGAAALLSGALLKALGPGVVAWAGREWNAYHVIFALSFVLRLLCIPLARRIREEGSTHSQRVRNDVLGDFPLRFLRFPVGLYRRFVPGGDDAGTADSPNSSPGSGR